MFIHTVQMDLFRDCWKSWNIHNYNKQQCQSLELNSIRFVTVIMILLDTW